MVRLLNDICVPRGPKVRAGGEHERGSYPSRKGVRGNSPEIFFEFNMSVEAIPMHFEITFAFKIRLIVHRHFMLLYSNVYRRLDNYFDPSSLECLSFLCIHVR